MGKVDIVYKQLLYGIQEQGFEYQDVRRSNVKRKQIKDARFELSMSDGFPLLTLKAMPFKLIVSELLWFIKGQTNIYHLHSSNNHIWDKDAYNYYVHICNLFDAPVTLQESSFVDFVTSSSLAELIMFSIDTNLPEDYVLGDVGKNYSHQWTNWGSKVNQLFNLVCNLRNSPMDSRHIVTGWNPSELNETALPPCHWSFEILVAPTPKFKQEEEGWPEYNFSLKWHQRSVDTFLGLPFNIASYALLGHIIQYCTGIHFNTLIADLSNVHIYSNHYDAVKQIEPLIPNTYGSPEITISSEAKSLFNSLNVTLLSEKAILTEKRDDFVAILNKLNTSDFLLHHYQSFEKIQADMVAPDKI